MIEQEKRQIDLLKKENANELIGSNNKDVIRRSEQALKMRKAGMTYPQIAKSVGMSVSGVRKIVKEQILRETGELQESKQELKYLNKSRLESLLSRYFNKDHLSDKEATICLNVIKELIRIDGLKIPEQKNAVNLNIDLNDLRERAERMNIDEAIEEGEIL